MTLEKAAGKLVPCGWLKEFLKRDKEGITGNLDKLFKDCAVDIFGKDKVVHLEDGYWSSWWAGESQGNWLHGFVALAFLTEDKELVARAKAQVDNILANQSEDGYIGVYKEGNRYIVTKRFGELWTQSRVMNTLLCYYGYTKEERVLQALVRMADNIVANVKGSVYEVPDEDGSKGHSLMIVEGLYELYRLTGKEAYRDFSEKLYLDYCAHTSQFLQDDIRMRNLFDPTVPFVGHGPHTCEMLRIPLLLSDDGQRGVPHRLPLRHGEIAAKSLALRFVQVRRVHRNISEFARHGEQRTHERVRRIGAAAFHGVRILLHHGDHARLHCGGAYPRRPVLCRKAGMDGL